MFQNKYNKIRTAYLEKIKPKRPISHDKMDPTTQATRTKTAIPANMVRKGGPWTLLVSPSVIASLDSPDGLFIACNEGNRLPINGPGAFLNLVKMIERLMIKNLRIEVE
ncbi:hypothetical protein Hanom_Chr00s000004g01608981 [Helianthus anomalus]